MKQIQSLCHQARKTNFGLDRKEKKNKKKEVQWFADAQGS